MSEKNFDDETLELIAYMLTSARELIDEPAIYGPFRLLEGASRLSEILIEKNHKKENALQRLKEKIDDKKFSVMTNREEFVALMDETVLDITDVLMEEDKE